MNKYFFALIFFISSISTISAQKIVWLKENQIQKLGSNSKILSSVQKHIIDQNKNIWEIFYLKDTINYLNQIFRNKGEADLLINKYDSNGAYLWSNHIKATGLIEYKDCCIDDSGNLSLLCNYEGKVELSNQIILDTFQYNLQGFFLKLDPNGTICWAYNHAFTNKYGGNIVNDKLGNLYLYTRPEIIQYLTKDSTLLNHNHNMITKIGNNGQIIWYKKTPYDYGNFSVSKNGNYIYHLMLLYPNNTIYFENDTFINNSKGKDFILTCFDSLGSKLSALKLKSGIIDSYEDYPKNNMYVDDYGNCYLTYRYIDTLIILNKIYFSQQAVPVFMKINKSQKIEWAVSTKDNQGWGFAGISGVSKNGIIYFIAFTLNEYNLNNYFLPDRSNVFLAFDTVGNLLRISDLFPFSQKNYLYANITATDGYSIVTTFYDSLEWNGQWYGNKSTKPLLLKLQIPDYNISINNIDLRYNISIYPNPTSDMINIENKGQRNLNLMLYNQNGMYITNINSTVNTIISYSIKNLPSGVYFIRDKDCQYKMKILKL